MPAFAAWKLLVPVAGVALIGLLMAQSGDFPTGKVRPQSASRSGTLGYLTPQELPDSVALLRPPPQPGSAAMKGDDEARAAVGWAYAQLLAELNPARARQIEERGREFGESRIVCDEEWLSDVDAARTVAGATMKHIEEKPAFRADFSAARSELATSLRSGIKAPNCQSETTALASR